MHDSQYSLGTLSLGASHLIQSVLPVTTDTVSYGVRDNSPASEPPVQRIFEARSNLLKTQCLCPSARNVAAEG